MAEIAPFRGLRYNPEKFRDLAQVVIPPYDVISPAEQEHFHRKSPHSFIRIELGEATPGDGALDNPHTRAAACLDQWLREQVLVRNPEPAIYYYEHDYRNGAEAPVKTRYGFICVLRLEDFSTGKVRPHEKTFKAIKDERLSLMLATNVNPSPVFGLYPDSKEEVDATLRAARQPAPVIDFTDEDGMAHHVWCVTETGALRHARDLMQAKPIFIADGHHRYETALNYRNVQRKLHGSHPRASCEYIMMYLTNLDQPGLTILPTHRVLRNLGSWDPEAFIAAARLFFDVRCYDAANGGDESGWKDDLAQGGARKETAIGFYCRETGCVYVLTAKREAVSAYLAQKGVPGPLQSLDVVILDRLVLHDLLGLSEEFLGNQHNISFVQDFEQALGAVRDGKFDAGFFINSTRIDQVQEVAGAGLIMPHKSTYFYPKVISGLVINPLSAHEEITW